MPSPIFWIKIGFYVLEYRLSVPHMVAHLESVTRLTAKENKQTKEEDMF